MATDTKESNRGQEITDEKFAFDPRKVAEGVKKAEDYANDPNNASDGSRDLNDLENPEFINNTSDTRETIKTRGRFSGRSRDQKKGPILVVILLLCGLGAGGTSVIPGPLVSMSKWLTNWSADDHRTLFVARGATIRGQLAKAVCNTTGIKCKLRTVSQSQLERIKAAGFKVKATETSFGRFRLTEIETPSTAKFEAGEGNKFNEHLRHHRGDQAAWYRVLHPKASWFTHPKARFSIALKNFKFNRSKSFEASNKKDNDEREKESNKNFDKVRNQEGFVDDPAKALTDTTKRVEADKNHSKFVRAMRSSGGRKVALATAAGDLMCMAKVMIQTANAAVKLYANRELAAFALEYLKIGDQIQLEGHKTGFSNDKQAQDKDTPEFSYADDGGQSQDKQDEEEKEEGLTPETSEWAMNNLTQYDTRRTNEDGTPNEKYGLTAMDSQGIKAALSGDFDKLSEFTEHYTSWWASGGIFGSELAEKTNSLLAKVHLDHSDIRTICLALKIASVAATIATGCGGVVGCAAAAGSAGAQTVLLNKYADELVRLLGKQAYERLASLNLNSKLYGVDLGNAFAAGVGTIMQYKNRGSGMKVARDKQQIKDYIAATKEVDEDDRRYALEEAKENQFDPTNEFSFMGKLARFVNPYRPSNNTPFGYIQNAFALNIASFNSINPFGASASALYSQPVELTNRAGSLDGSTNRDTRCKDPDLEAIGVECILPGTEKYITEAPMLEKLKNPKDNGEFVDEIIDYMQGNNHPDNPKNVKYIDNDGRPNDNEYKQWIQYCTEQREYPIGVAGEALDQFVGSPETEGESFFNRIVNTVIKAGEYVPSNYVLKKLGIIDVGQLGKDTWAYAIQKVFPEDVAQNIWPELISSSEMGYYMGSRCAGNTLDGKADTPEVNKMIDMFGLYYNICYSQVAVPDDQENCYEEKAPTQGKPCKDGWTYPVDKGSTTVSSPFGDRDGGQHRGIDLAGPIGTPVVAACDGTVVKAGAADGFGQWIVIDHDVNGEKYSTVYGHVDQIFVHEGQQVKAGEVIGTRGNQGQSSGPHLHFEIWKGGRLNGGTAIDPAPSLYPVGQGSAVGSQ